MTRRRAAVTRAARRAVCHRGGCALIALPYAGRELAGLSFYAAHI